MGKTLVVVGALVSVLGCAHANRTNRNEEPTTRTYKERRPPGEWIYSAEVTVANDTFPAEVDVIARRTRQCEIVTHHVRVREAGETPDPLGEDDEITVESVECASEPVPNVPLRLSTGPTVLADARTDGHSVAHFDVPAVRGMVHSLQLTIDGQPVDSRQLDGLRMTLNAPSRRQDRAREAETQRQQIALIRARLDQEIVDGRCSPESHATLDAVFQRANTFARLMTGNGSGNLWEVKSHSFEILRPTGSTFQVRPGFRGEHHIVAVAIEPPQMTLLDHGGYPITAGSEHNAEFGTGDSHTVSRVAHNSTGEALTAQIKGYGCVLLMVIEVTR